MSPLIGNMNQILAGLSAPKGPTGPAEEPDEKPETTNPEPETHEDPAPDEREE